MHPAAALEVTHVGHVAIQEFFSIQKVTHLSALDLLGENERRLTPFISLGFKQWEEADSESISSRISTAWLAKDDQCKELTETLGSAQQRSKCVEEDLVSLSRFKETSTTS
jgi:hypothetical protein